MKTFLTILCLTSLLSAARAEKNAPTIILKHKSTFEPSVARDPFWLIGWTKPNAKSANETGSAPVISPSSFNLTSVTMGAGPRFAILNGKVMQEGQQFGLQSGTQIYRVTVQAIQDGQVVLVYEGGEIVVPLRRH